MARLARSVFGFSGILRANVLLYSDNTFSVSYHEDEYNLDLYITGSKTTALKRLEQMFRTSYPNSNLSKSGTSPTEFILITGLV